MPDNHDRFVSEDYFKLGDLPVMVCVLTLSNASFSVGYSVAKPKNYDDGVARALSKRNAIRLHESFKKRRGEQEAT